MNDFSSSSSDDSSSTGSAELDEAIDIAVEMAVNLMMQVVKDKDDEKTTLERKRVEANKRLMSLYFVDEPVFNERVFRRRFRMSKRLFLEITSDLEEENAYFQQKYDSRGKLGFTAIQKCTSAIRQLAYGSNEDLFGENLGMSPRTSRESLIMFCRGIIELYGPTYLRRPTSSDLQRIYDVHLDVHGFMGMVGSIDCMNWPWETCPADWRSTHPHGDIGRPSLILQAVASNDLWIWNAYFGERSSNNDITVFESSPIIEEIISGLAATAMFETDENEYKYGYYLTDDIYPEYVTFVKNFTDPIDDKRKFFKIKHESARKDIERAFSVLKRRWRVISSPSQFWDKEIMHDVIYTCIILHNMILQDENKAFCQDYDDSDPSLDPKYWTQPTPMEEWIENSKEVRSRETHNMLMTDLVDEVWGNSLLDEVEVSFDINTYVSDDDS